jgi:hypothetical protein
VWGTRSNPQTIFIDGYKTHITDNLHTDLSIFGINSSNGVSGSMQYVSTKRMKERKPTKFHSCRQFTVKLTVSLSGLEKAPVMVKRRLSIFETLQKECPYTLNLQLNWLDLWKLKPAGIYYDEIGFNVFG